MTTSTQTQIRRGTEAQCNAMTPASSEFVHDTTNNRARAGNGSYAGGMPLPNFQDIQKQYFSFATCGGTGNAITLTNTYPVLALAQPLKQIFKATNANTSSMTATVDGLTAKNILKMKNGVLTNMESGDIVVGGIYEITYDGTQFQIKGLDEALGSTPGWTLLSVVTGGGSEYDFTSGITSLYHSYKIIFENLIPATNSVNLISRVGAGSFSGSGYAWVLNKLNDAGTNANSGSSSSSGVRLYASAANSVNGGKGVSGEILYAGLGQAVRANTLFHTYESFPTGGSPNNAICHGGGFLDSASALDRIALLFDSGNISSGDARLYGLKSAV